MDPSEKISEWLGHHRYDLVLKFWSGLKSRTRSSLADRCLVDVALARACVGDLERAIYDLRAARSAQSVAVQGAGGSYSELIAAFLYLEGRAAEASGECAAVIAGLKNRSIAFADGAGGVWPGLLLFAFGSLEHNDENITAAKKWVAALSKRGRYKNWPGPLGDLILKRRSIEQISQEEFGESGPDRLIDRSNHDLYVRKCTISLFFYEALMLNERRREAESEAFMIACAKLENTHLEPEWYIARRKVGLNFWWRPGNQMS